MDGFAPEIKPGSAPGSDACLHSFLVKYDRIHSLYVLQILQRQAEAKEKTPPSTRRRGRTPRRSPRDRVAVSPHNTRAMDKMLLTAS